MLKIIGVGSSFSRPEVCSGQLKTISRSNSHPLPRTLCRYDDNPLLLNLTKLKSVMFQDSIYKSLYTSLFHTHCMHQYQWKKKTVKIEKQQENENNIFSFCSFPTDFRNCGSCLNVPDVALSRHLTNSPLNNQMPSSTTRDTILSMHSQHHQFDTATDSSIMHPPQTTTYDRNGINFNRGLSFLRNAIFGHGITTSKINNGGTCDAKDYKLLNHTINSQSDQYVHPLQKI